MTPLIQSYIAAALRWAITLAVGYVIKHGADAAAVNGLAAGLNVESISAAVVGGGTIAWSLWHKSATNTALVVAAATGTTTATPTKASSAAVSAALPAVPVGTPPISKPL